MPCQVWYVRFSLDFDFRILACGDQDGRLRVYDLSRPTDIQRFKLEDDQCTTVVETVPLCCFS